MKGALSRVFKKNEVFQNFKSNKTQSAQRRDNFQQWGGWRNSHFEKQMHMHSSRMDSSRKLLRPPAPARGSFSYSKLWRTRKKGSH